jgi:hypothetical protein
MPKITTSKTISNYGTLFYIYTHTHTQVQVHMLNISDI